MSDLSIYGKIFLALELAKDTGVGCEFTNFEAIELLGYIRALNEYIGLDNVRIAELEAQHRWIPVSERLPEVMKEVICAYEKYVFQAHYFEGHWRTLDGILEYKVTHWMPLPEPPKEEE